MRLFYGWYVVVATFIAISFGFGLAYYNNPVFYPAYIDEFGWSRTVVAFGGTLSFFSFGIFGPFIGILADRFSIKKIILAGLFCDGLSKISFGVMNSLPQYYLTNIVLGVAMVCTSMISNKLLIAKWFRRREGLALGIVDAGFAVGGGLGPILTSYLLGQYGWRKSHLLLSGLLWAIAIPVFWFVVRDTPEEKGLLPEGAPLQEPQTRHNHPGSSPDAGLPDLTVRQALTIPTFWLLCSAILLFHFCIISISQHLVLHLTDIGLNVGSASMGLSLLLSTSILGRTGFGALSDRYSKKQLMILAYLLFFVMIFALFLTSTSWLPAVARSTTVIYAIAALIGIGYGGGVVCIPIVAGKCFGLSSLGKILGLIMVFIAIGGAIGPVLVGYLFDIRGAYQLAFFIVSMAAFAAVACLSFIKTDLRIFFRVNSPKAQMNPV